MVAKLKDISSQTIEFLENIYPGSTNKTEVVFSAVDSNSSLQESLSNSDSVLHSSDKEVDDYELAAWTTRLDVTSFYRSLTPPFNQDDLATVCNGYYREALLLKNAGNQVGELVALYRAISVQQDYEKCSNYEFAKPLILLAQELLEHKCYLDVVYFSELALHLIMESEVFEWLPRIFNFYIRAVAYSADVDKYQIVRKAYLESLIFADDENATEKFEKTTEELDDIVEALTASFEE